MKEKIQRQLVLLLAALKKAIYKDLHFYISVYERKVIVDFILNSLALGKSQLKPCICKGYNGDLYVHWSFRLPRIPIPSNISHLFRDLFQETQDITIKSIVLYDLQIYPPEDIDLMKCNIDSSIDTIKRFLLDNRCEFNVHIKVYYLSDLPRNYFYRNITFVLSKNGIIFQKFYPTVKAHVAFNSAEPFELERKFEIQKLVTAKQHIFHVRKCMLRQYEKCNKIGKDEYLFYDPIDIRKEGNSDKKAALVKMTDTKTIIYRLPQRIRSTDDATDYRIELNDFLIENTDCLVLERVDDKIIVRPVIRRIYTKKYMLTLQCYNEFSFSLPLKLGRFKMPTLFFDVKKKKWTAKDVVEMLLCDSAISYLYYQTRSRFNREYFSADSLEELQDVARRYLSFCAEKIDAALNDLKKGKTPDAFVDFSSLSKRDISLLLS